MEPHDPPRSFLITGSILLHSCILRKLNQNLRKTKILFKNYWRGVPPQVHQFTKSIHNIQFQVILKVNVFGSKAYRVKAARKRCALAESREDKCRLLHLFHPGPHRMLFLSLPPLLHPLSSNYRHMWYVSTQGILLEL